MGFKLGVIAGFGAGYYLGAKAGRERYEQMNRWKEKAKQTEAYNVAAAKAREVADEAVEKGKDMAVDSLLRAREKAEDGVERVTDDLSDDTASGTTTHLPTQGISNN